MINPQRILVVSEDVNLIGELIGAARRLNSEGRSVIAAVVAGDQSAVRRVASFGVDQIYQISPGARRPPCGGYLF